MESRLGSRTRGVWTRGAALRAGVPPGVVRQRLLEGAWQPVHRGVYADGGYALDARQRAWAAVLALGPRSVAARRSAARVWGLPLVDDDDPATGRREREHDDVACPRAVRDRPLLHPARLALAPQEVTRVAGCPCTRPLRTLWDLTAVLRPDALVCALDDALHRGLVTPAQLQGQVARRGGSPYAAAFRRAVALADGRAESPLETLGRLVLLPALPSLVPQVRVRSPAGLLLARVDLGDPAVRFGVEADGRAGHEGGLMVRRDRARERRVAPYGWVLERYGWFDARCEPDALRERVVAAWRARARRLA